MGLGMRLWPFLVLSIAQLVPATPIDSSPKFNKQSDGGFVLLRPVTQSGGGLSRRGMFDDVIPGTDDDRRPFWAAIAPRGQSVQAPQPRQMEIGLEFSKRVENGVTIWEEQSVFPFYLVNTFLDAAIEHIPGEASTEMLENLGDLLHKEGPEGGNALLQILRREENIENMEIGLHDLRDQALAHNIDPTTQDWTISHMVALYKYFEDVEETYFSVAEAIGALFDKLQPAKKGARPLSDDFMDFAAVRMANAKLQLYGPTTSIPDEAGEISKGYWGLVPIPVDKEHSVATRPQLEIPKSRARETDFEKLSSGGILVDIHTEENAGEQLGGIFSSLPVNRVAKKSWKGAALQPKDKPSLDKFVVGKMAKDAMLNDKYAQQYTEDLGSLAGTEQPGTQPGTQSQKPGRLWKQPAIRQISRLLSVKEEVAEQMVNLPPRAKGKKWPFGLGKG